MILIKSFSEKHVQLFESALLPVPLLWKQWKVPHHVDREEDEQCLCFHLGPKVKLRIGLFGWLNWIINLEIRISLFCIVVKDSSYKVEIDFSLSTSMIFWQESWLGERWICIRFCSSSFRRFFQTAPINNRYCSERSTILDFGYKTSAMNAEFLEFSSMKAPNAINDFE